MCENRNQHKKVATSVVFSYVIACYSVSVPSQLCLANIEIAEDVLGSPCIYFRHSSYLYFGQGDACTRVIVHASTLAIVHACT